jgi:hypothetical protein
MMDPVDESSENGSVPTEALSALVVVGVKTRRVPEPALEYISVSLYGGGGTRSIFSRIRR